MSRLSLVGLFLVLAAAGNAQPQITIEPVAGGFNRPLLVTHAGDGSGRIFVVEQRGRIRILQGGAVLLTDFLDLGSAGLNLVSISGNERGLLGMAFHPDYKSNGRLFVSYTRRTDGYSIVSEFAVSALDPNLADTTSERIVIGPIQQPQSNHNGGHIAFGPDGFLYLGLGDGGGAGDQHGSIGNGQDTGTLLGKILRVDVNGATPFAIPPDNPFVGNPAALDEIWAYGLRNPWRFSFDRQTGRLFCADVGQDAIEEIDLIVKGGNYGWRRMEGSSCFNPATNCQTGSLLLPIHEYPQSSGRCSVTGGHVYRGKAYRPLSGLYFYGDFCTGEIWTLEETSPGVWTNRLVLDTTLRISSFGEDEDGEIYVCDLNGLVQKIVGPETSLEVQRWILY